MSNIVIFRNSATNEILKYQKMSEEEWPTEKLEKAIQDYNENSTAAIASKHIVSEGSFEEYLIKELDKKIRYSKEAIEQALSYLEAAVSEISSLTPTEDGCG